VLIAKPCLGALKRSAETPNNSRYRLLPLTARGKGKGRHLGNAVFLGPPISAVVNIYWEGMKGHPGNSCEAANESGGGRANNQFPD